MASTSDPRCSALAAALVNGMVRVTSLFAHQHRLITAVLRTSTDGEKQHCIARVREIIVDTEARKKHILDELKSTLCEVDPHYRNDVTIDNSLMMLKAMHFTNPLEPTVPWPCLGGPCVSPTVVDVPTITD